MSFNDIALVTGARGGIGCALVNRLRARGLRVAAVGRDLATLVEVLAEAHIAAATYAAQGLRVNAVAPGMTETPMTQGMLKLPAMREGASRQYPLGGVQTADEVAAAMDWLLSPDSGRLTGQVLAVDGGFTTVRPLVK